MPRKTLKRQRKQRGGKVGYIPIIDDIWRFLYFKFNENHVDKDKNRDTILAKTKALKELISWIELSLGNIKRSAIKSENPFITQFANRALFNRFNNDYFSKNLVTSEQLNDYTQHDTLALDQELWLDDVISKLYPQETSIEQQKKTQQLGTAVFGYMLIRYLKQIYLLINGSATGTVFENTNNYRKILFPQVEPNKPELPENSDFVVFEDYKKFLTKKFGEKYLDTLKENYNMVRNYIYSEIKPKLLEMQNSVIEKIGNINQDIIVRQIEDENAGEITGANAGGTRKKQIRNKPRKRKSKNKTGKKQYK